MSRSSSQALRPTVFFVPALLALFIAAPTRAEDDSQREWRAVARELAGDAAVSLDYATCVGAVAGSRADRPSAISGALSTDLCLAKPRLCLDLCRRHGDAKACAHFGWAAQKGEPTIPPRIGAAFFARACLLGYAAGCTNRASGIRNGDYADDPFRNAGLYARVCEFKAFRFACAHNDAWGCAMLGQAYGNGEGVHVDKTAALAAYKKTCDLAPAFVACETAKSNIETLSAPASVQRR